MTRVQRERFFNEEDYLRLKDSYILTPDKLQDGQAGPVASCTRCRVSTKSPSPWTTTPAPATSSRCINGKYIRMALILKLLGIG